MQTIEISLYGMTGIYLMLLIPFGLMLWLKLGMIRESLFAVLRMTAQLFLVGLYLDVIFDLSSTLLNTVWICIMLITANLSVLSRSGLSIRRMFAVTIVSTAFSTSLLTALFIIGILRTSPANARYLIPVFGMILGNCMRGNVILLERFYSGIRENEMEFTTYRLLGATLFEAIRPYLRRSVKASVSPYISTMATMGIVSLPGMLTGQILGGALPMNAIKYQIAIMVCIFSATFLAATLNVLFSTMVAFDGSGMLRQDVFS